MGLSTKIDKDGGVDYELILKIKIGDPQAVAAWAMMFEGQYGNLKFYPSQNQMQFEDKLDR